jgi:3-oxoacyl-[acyl-carrier protein] reductase
VSRTFLVTGCASGIGRDLASAIVEGGDRLVATDIDAAALAAAAREQAWPSEAHRRVRLDVTDAAQWRAAFAAATEAFGPVDVLVNMAGFLRPGYVHELSEDDIAHHLDVNVRGVMLGTHLAAQAMRARGSGHIVNVASLAALAPIPGLSLYSASKYAVRAFSLAAAQELRAFGVAVTVVCPDAVATPMLDLQKDYEEAALTFSGPRVLHPREVSEAILGPVLRQRPLEVFLPPGRGWLARVADVFPRSASAMAPLLRRRGRSRQRDFDR